MIELVDFNEIYGKGTAKAAEPAKKTRRAGSKKKAAAETAAEETTETAVEETKEA